MQERDKFLTEAMGECWHNSEIIRGDSIHIPITVNCSKCGALVGKEGSGGAKTTPRTDFSTWPGFGKLWEWAQKQDWWNLFSDKFVEDVQDGLETIFLGPIVAACIHPDRFANAVYEFLKGREP